MNSTKSTLQALFTIPFDDLSAGIYVLKIKTDAGFDVKKLIKN